MVLCCRKILQVIALSNRKIVLATSPSCYFHNHKYREITDESCGRCISTVAKVEKNTVNVGEVEKFEQQSEDWWDSKTTFGILRSMNRLRVPLIRDGILGTCSPPRHEKTPKPLKGFSILDVGCGGGLLSEPLARLGANVTGIDPGAENIKAAQNHAELDDKMKQNLEYICGVVDDLDKEKKYDAVVCSEVIEHVDSVDHFVKSCVDLVENNGSIFFTTPNRTAVSYVSTILIVEYALGMIPRGTHDWKKFVTPHDLKHMLQSYGCRTLLIHGMIYNPVCKNWSWSSYNGMDYALHAVKENTISD